MATQLYGPRWRGAALGLASAVAGLATSSLVAGLLGGAVSPTNAVGGTFIDNVPPWLKTLAVKWFGDKDKLVLKIGIAVVLALAGVLIGVLAQRRKMNWAYGLTIALGVVGVAALIKRPEAGAASIVATIIGTAVSCAVLYRLAPSTRVTADAAGAPVAITDAAAPSATDSAGDPVPTAAVAAAPSSAPGAGAAASTPDASRRSFLAQLGVVGIGSVAVGFVGSLLGRRASVESERSGVTLPEAQQAGTETTTPSNGTTSAAQYEVPESALSAADAAAPDYARMPQPVSVLGEVAGPTEFGIEGVTPFVVPSGEFYKIDTSLSTPQISTDTWMLRIHGMVDNELELSYQDLLDRPQIERTITIACVSNGVGGRYVGNATWQGVRLADLLNEAGIAEGATQVASRSFDGWSCGSPTAIIMDGRDAMVALGMNGEALPADHGYPARLVVPGLYGYVSATKWLTEIELVRWEDFDGYWMPRGWAKLGPIKTMARIDKPRSARPATPNADNGIDIAGVAWAVHRGISKVEVSIDDGDWLECELAGVPSDDTWREWRYVWADAPSGSHTVRARAVDGRGEPQPVGPKAEAPDGAEGYHEVTFEV